MFGPRWRPPHTQLPARGARQGLKATFPRRSCWSRARPQSAPFRAVPAQSPEHLRVWSEGKEFQLPAARTHTINASLFPAKVPAHSDGPRTDLQSLPIQAKPWAPDGNGQVEMVKRCVPRGTQPQVLDRDPWWRGRGGGRGLELPVAPTSFIPGLRWPWATGAVNTNPAEPWELSGASEFPHCQREDWTEGSSGDRPAGSVWSLVSMSWSLPAGACALELTRRRDSTEPRPFWAHGRPSMHRPARSRPL